MEVVRCVRKDDNHKAYMEEVILANEEVSLYLYGKHLIILDLTKLQEIELSNNIVLVGFNSKTDFEPYIENEYYFMENQKNITIQDKTLYGIILALKKVNNKYFGLTLDEVDKCMEILNS